jgi:hypothetical protein
MPPQARLQSQKPRVAIAETHRASIMTVAMKPLLLLLAMLLLTLQMADAQSGPAMEFMKREIPWGQAVSLELFGGPPIEVAVRSRQVSFVTAEIADFTRMVPVVVNDSTIYGPSRVVMQPTRETRRVEKKNGVPIPGGRSDMFLLYIEPTTGVQVYFADEAAAQNMDVLVFGVPRGTEHAAEPEPDPELAPTVAAQAAAKRAPKSDGYLSDKLLDWYLRLEERRERLNLNDPEAVQLFNESAELYHAEVKRERAMANAKR